MIAIVDYGMGNLRSVEKAFENAGGRVCVTADRRIVERAEKIVLPGVGGFAQAMHELRSRKLVEPISSKIKAGTPYLGICLGLQLLFSQSDEGGKTRGFGVIPGPVRRFTGNLKIPHMGWNDLTLKKPGCPLFKGTRKKDYFYFVHSYYPEPEDRSWVATTTRYGRSFCSAVWKGSVLATQFHPEKSQEAGLRLVRNFVNLPALAL